MKRLLIVLIGALILGATTGAATADSMLNSAIRMYKSGNYTQAYSTLNTVVEKEPSNALAYYYLAMTSAQIGKKNEAIENYSKVITLSDNGHLTRYAMKGMTCLETPDLCNKDLPDETDLDRFIRKQYWNGFSEQVMGDYDKQKIDELRRMMNRGDEIPPGKFKEFKDFSASVPTENEIAEALDVLERAGIGNASLNPYSKDLAFLNYKNDESDFINYMFSENGNDINPQAIQALITNQMSLGF